MAIKTPSILPELQKFVETIGPDVPYDKLLSTAAEAGYGYRLTQREVLFSPEGDYLVTFDVQIGRENTFEHFDTVSIAVAPQRVGPSMPLSLAARFHIVPTLIYLFFGRLPPQLQQAATAPAETTIDASEGTDDVVLPDLEDEDRGFPAAEPFVPSEPEELDVIDHREPDGVPIFKDLYSVGGPDVTADVVISAVMDVIKPFTIKVSSKEELLALYTKNPDLNQFMIDFGTPEERAALKEVLDRALARLNEAASPREVRIPQGTRRRTPKAA